MKSPRNFPRPGVRCPAYRQAFQRLEEALEENTNGSNAEKLQLMGRHLFGDLWPERKPTGTENLPQ